MAKQMPSKQKEESLTLTASDALGAVGSIIDAFGDAKQIPEAIKKSSIALVKSAGRMSNSEKAMWITGISAAVGLLVWLNKK